MQCSALLARVLGPSTAAASLTRQLHVKVKGELSGYDIAKVGTCALARLCVQGRALTWFLLGPGWEHLGRTLPARAAQAQCAPRTAATNLSFLVG
jgi:hypothetical protein